MLCRINQRCTTLAFMAARAPPGTPSRVPFLTLLRVTSDATGISYGLNAASEWRSILEEAVKGAIILAILERLFLTRNSGWLEEVFVAS